MHITEKSKRCNLHDAYKALNGEGSLPGCEVKMIVGHDYNSGKTTTACHPAATAFNALILT